MHFFELLPCAIGSLIRVALLLATMAGAVIGNSMALAQSDSRGAASTPQIPTASTVPTADDVIEIRILGNETISASKIDEHISTRIGRPFDSGVVQRDVRRLFNLGWFVDVKPLYETTPQGRIVIFKVVERPTIRYVTYLGNEEISDKKLSKETGLETGGAVDPYAVEEGRRKLIEYYQGRGHNNVQITIIEGTKATDKGIVYLINEGNSQKIRSIDFIGNEFASDGRLKTLVMSKPPKFFFYKGYLDREEIDADVNRLIAYYRSFGFFQAKISRKIDRTSNKGKVNLTYVIHEGPRYKVRNVKFIGNTTFDAAAMAEATKLKTGDPFEQSKVGLDRRWVQELYGSHGYVFADVNPETVFLEEPGEIDLIYRINEGEQFRIGNIIVNIDGENPHTRMQTILNRMSLRPGDIADTREIEASRRRVGQSGLFENPEVTFQITEEDAEFNLANRPKRRRSRPSAPPAGPPGGGDGSGSRGGGFGGGGGGSGFRGQSPDTERRPEVLPPPAYLKKKTQAEAPVIRGQSPSTTPAKLPAWVRSQQHYQTQNYQTQTTRKPLNAYHNIRGQSPGSATRSTYSGLPVGGVPAQSQYGGQIVGATGPASQPIAAQSGNVQQVQFSENIPPPAGSFGPTPGLSANAVPGYQLFPDGRFGPPGQPFPQQTVDLIFNGTETQTGRLQFGVGVNSDAGLVGNIVLDERNFDWRRFPTSFESVRNGQAFRGGGQRFRLEASPGSEVNRYLFNFTEPYLGDSPVSLNLSGSFFDRRFRDYDETRLGGRIGLGHQWVDRDLTLRATYRGENVRISDAPNAGLVPELAEVLGSNAIHGFRLTAINDTRDSTFLPTQGRYLELSGEYVTGSFDFPRVTIDYRRFFLLRERPDRSGRHVLSVSTNVGWLGDDAPIFEHFFAGGFSTLRGFDFRGASPVDAATGVELGGEFQWINSVQYLFPITADDTVHGVVFSDFGTVEEDVEIIDFRVVLGVGLRIAVPALGPAPIALDFGWAVNEAPTDDTQVFSFSTGFGR